MKFLDELRTLREQINFKGKISDISGYNKLIIAGMGGSGIAGKIFQELYTGMPLFNLDGYHVPDYVDSNTLFIATSYSGNTEETLSSAREAMDRGARVVAITSGGKLASLVKEAIKIPSGIQPRSAMGYLMMPLLNTFMDLDDAVIGRIGDLLWDLDEDNEYIRSEAGKLAADKSIPIVYGHSPFRWVAYRWKTQFNENSKVMAYSNYFPELNHNELVPLKDSYGLDNFRFYIFDGGMDTQTEKRVRFTENSTGIGFHRIPVKGETNIEKIFYLIHYGDYLTYHLALERGIDPTDVSILQDLKRSIARNNE